MNEQTNSLSTAPHDQTLPAFLAMLSAGAMLATFAVVTYACTQSGASAVRAHVILQGFEVILLTWAAGFLASALHRVFGFSEAMHGAVKPLPGRAATRS